MIARPGASSASTRHALTGAPSISTVQVPQLPLPQPSLVPVSPRRSRNRSSSVSRVSARTLVFLAVHGAAEQRLHRTSDLETELAGAIGERARGEHGDERAAKIGGSARIRDRARILRGEPAGLLEQRAARPFTHELALGGRSANRRRRDRGEHKARLRDGAVVAEPQPGPASRHRDVHLAPRREAQIGRRRARAAPAAAGSRPCSSPARELRPPRPGEHRLDRHLARAAGPGNQRLCAETDQCRHAVRRGRRIADVAAEARAVLHLHAADELRGSGDGRIARRNRRMPRHRGRASRRTDRHAAVGQHRRSPIRSGDMLQVDDARRAAPPFAQLRHEIGAAGERACIARAHRRNGVRDGLGPLIDEFLQWTGLRIPRSAASLYGRPAPARAAT